MWERKGRSKEINCNVFHNFSFPLYYVRGALVIAQIFDFRFLADLHVLGLENQKNKKLAWDPGVR